MLLSFIVTPLHSAPPGQIVERVLWTLTFAAQLVLLVVLLGRDRARRYPWFTAGIALASLRLMAEVLLTGRMATPPLQETLLTLADLAVIVGLLVLVELARRAFAGLQRFLWIVNAAGMLVVAGGVLTVWGPWPARKDLVLDSLLGRLRLMQLLALKGELLVALLTVVLGSDFSAAAKSDAVADTIDYFAVTQRLLKFGEGREWKLIEKLAADVAAAILAEFRPQAVSVEVKKFIIPQARFVAVAVTRSR